MLFSDLLDLPEDAASVVGALGARQRAVVLVQVLDPDEADLGFSGKVRLKAIEGDAEVETDADAVRIHESRSLDLLNSALEEAKRLDNEMQQQEQDRKKAELLKAYRDALTAQIALRDETEAYTDKDNLTRRDRAALRSIANEQDSIREALEVILESTEELADAEVYTFAHGRLTKLTEAASNNLRETQPLAASRRQTAAIAVLQGIVESLQEDAPPRDDNFNDGGGGGGNNGDSGGQQPQQLLPPIAQLRLLRQMQADLLDRTRLTDELQGEPGVDSTTDLGAEQRQLGEIGSGIIEKMSEQSSEGQGQMPIQPE